MKRFLLPALTACLIAGILPAQEGSTQQEVQAEKVPTFTEKSTKAEFPLYLVDGKRKLQLTGAGVRKKFIVKVYAVALYVDAKEAARQLVKWRNTPAKKLRKDKAFWSALSQNDFSKTVFIKMTYDVDAEKMRDAWADAFEGRLAEDSPEYIQFMSYWTTELTKGTELRLDWRPEGVMTTTIAGKTYDKIESLELCQALFDIWLGSDPISKSAKMAMGERIPDLLGKAKVDGGEPE